MRFKKLSKKLVLNKITISNLNGNAMRQIYGGAQKETVKNSRCFTCVETDACETDDCESIVPETCQIPSTGSIENSCDTVCNC